MKDEGRRKRETHDLQEPTSHLGGTSPMDWRDDVQVDGVRPRGLCGGPVEVRVGDGGKDRLPASRISRHAMITRSRQKGGRHTLPAGLPREHEVMNREHPQLRQRNPPMKDKYKGSGPNGEDSCQQWTGGQGTVDRVAIRNVLGEHRERDIRLDSRQTRTAHVKGDRSVDNIERGETSELQSQRARRIDRSLIGACGETRRELNDPHPTPPGKENCAQGGGRIGTTTTLKGWGGPHSAPELMMEECTVEHGKETGKGCVLM